MISTFGAEAVRYARGLSDLDAVVTTIDRIADAFLEAVKRRHAGRPFYAMVLFDDPRIAFGYAFGEAILATEPDYDRRRLLIDQLTRGTLVVDAGRVDGLWKIDSMVEGVVTEFYALADAALVRSYAEAARVNAMFARVTPRRPLPPLVRILAAADVPQPVRVRPELPGVVVWGPHRPAIHAALHLHGMAEFFGEVTCVSAGGPLPGRTTARFCLPTDPVVDEALARASAVVCVDPSDPSEAVAFARRGYGVVAPLTAGAHEFCDVVTWDALNARFLHTAAAVALSRPARVREEPPPVPSAPAAPERPPFVTFEQLPLVSIVTPTYNRRQFLREMLTCLAVQTYPNLEAVVVNDGGEPVDDIVAEFPFARLIDVRPNAGALRAVERGIAEARGEYIGLLPDDDWLYPDHVERLMNAMFRSGAKIAHGAALLRFVRRDGKGGWQTYGFNNRTFSLTNMPTDALITSQIGGHQMLVHKSVYATLGGYLLDSDVSDNEIHMRFTRHHFYAFCDHVTAEFRDHAGGQGRVCDFPAALSEIYRTYHPTPDRPLLNRTRQSTIEHIAARPAGEPPFAMSVSLASSQPPA